MSDRAHSRQAKLRLEPDPLLCNRTLGLGLLGSLLCYLAHPPANLSLLAWIGPTPWLLLCRAERMPGRRPYLALWLAGTAFWLAAIQWIRLPHPANNVGLLFMAGYLGTYLPLFVGLTRVGAQRVGMPLWFASPVVWTGLEWLRARLLTGFLMASLAHTQVRSTAVIQIADLAGEYIVSFLIVLVAAAIAQSLPLWWFGLATSPAGEPEAARPRRLLLRPLAIAVVAVAAAIAYGAWRLVRFESVVSSGDARPGPRIALVQSDLPALWKGEPDRDAKVMTQQMQLSRDAVRTSDRPVDVVIWPETMYREPLWTIDESQGPPSNMIDLAKLNATPEGLAAKANELGAALIMGIDRANLISTAGAPGEASADGGMHPFRVDIYNSVACVDRAGKLQGTYDKMHLLPFGEYVPFVRWLPFLQGYSPITGSSLPGQSAAAFELDGVTYAPNICYETVLPQIIRGQVVELIRRDQRPDVLVNVTNDAWYWGSSELDMHLASGAFRAIEMRTPLVVAANRGLSAYIDLAGRTVAVTKRDEPAALVVDVRLPQHAQRYPSLYARLGDWLAVPSMLSCLMLAAVGWRDRRLRSRMKTS